MTTTLPPFVQELLDHGSDPLADPRAQQWLLAHPEALEAFAKTRRALGELGTTTPAARPWPRVWPWLAVMAATAIVATVLAFAGESRRTPRPLPRPDFAPMTIVSCRVKTSEAGGITASEHVLTGNLLRTSEHYVCAPTSAARRIAARIVEQRTLTP